MEDTSSRGHADHSPLQIQAQKCAEQQDLSTSIACLSIANAAGGQVLRHLVNMDWKSNNKTYQILKAAEDGGYGVVAAIA